LCCFFIAHYTIFTDQLQLPFDSTYLDGSSITGYTVTDESQLLGTTSMTEKGTDKPGKGFLKPLSHRHNVTFGATAVEIGFEVDPVAGTFYCESVRVTCRVVPLLDEP
jgi:hypothetical protein